MSVVKLHNKNVLSLLILYFAVIISLNSPVQANYKPIGTNITANASPTCIETAAIDAILGRLNWIRLGNGYDTGIKVSNLPDQGSGVFSVALPVTQIDKQGIVYHTGDTVPSGGDATVWFNSVVGVCSATCLSLSSLDAILRPNNWIRLDGIYHYKGVIVSDLPDQGNGFFSVYPPVTQIDKDGLSYYRNQQVPSGGRATIWFDRSIDLCSSVYLPLILNYNNPLNIVWFSDNISGVNSFQGPNREDFCDFSNTSDDVDKTIWSNENPPVIELTANMLRRPGVVVNALTHRDVFTITQMTQEFANTEIYNRIWYAWGEFKRGSQTELQNNAINLQFVENGKEHVALLQWILNPDDVNYGWIMLRSIGGDIQIHRIVNDTIWHKWAIETEYRSNPEEYIIKRIIIDDIPYNINAQTPIGPPKNWLFSFAVLLEVTNKWTGCNQTVASTGSMYYRNIGIGYR